MCVSLYCRTVGPYWTNVCVYSFSCGAVNPRGSTGQKNISGPHLAFFVFLVFSRPGPTWVPIWSFRETVRHFIWGTKISFLTFYFPPLFFFFVFRQSSNALCPSFLRLYLGPSHLQQECETPKKASQQLDICKPRDSKSRYHHSQNIHTWRRKTQTDTSNTNQ